MLNQPGGLSTAAAGGSTTADVNLTSAGSTRLVGQVTVANPTTAVTVSNPSTAVTVTNPTTAVTVSNPTTSVSLSSQHTVTVGNPTTAVTVSNPTTSVSLSSQHTVTIGNPTTAVTVSSGVVLGAGSTANNIGAVSVANPTTSVTVSSGVVLGPGSSANTLGAVAQAPGSTSIAPWYVISTAAAGAGSTTVDANLSSAGSTRIVGLVDGISFSSGVTVFTTINSSVDSSLLAASSARRGCIIQNGSTGTALLVVLSTQTVSSASAYQFQVPANGFVVMGGQVGNMPNFIGPMRCKVYSTALAGPVFVTAFNSS